MAHGWLGWDWGNVPSWVGSLLTGSSLGLAAITYFRASEDRRRSRQDAERAEAARVSIWWINPRKATVRNANDVAVTVLALLSRDRGDDWSGWSERLGLAPGETRNLLLAADVEDRSPELALAVVDSHGRSWMRHGDGTLERLTTESSTSLPRRPASRPPQVRWEPR